MRRRREQQQCEDKVATHKATVAEMKEWLSEMKDEVTQHQLNSRKASKAAHKQSKLAATRLEKLRAMKEKVGEMRDELADASQLSTKLGDAIASARLEIKRERVVGRRGGSASWPVKVVLMICELLVNGTPPSAVPSNLQTFAGHGGAEMDGPPPGIDFVRKCRVIVQNLNEMLAAFELSDVEWWSQACTDGTTRRQIPAGCLVIGIVDKITNQYRSIIASSCIYSESESAEMQVEGILNKVRVLLY